MLGFLRKKQPKYEIADIISIILKIKKEATPGNYVRLNQEFLGVIVDKQYAGKEYVYDIDIISKNKILHNIAEHYIKRKFTDEEVNEYVKNHPDIKAELDKSLLEDIADELSGFGNIDLPLMTETLEENKDNKCEENDTTSANEDINKSEEESIKITDNETKVVLDDLECNMRINEDGSETITIINNGEKTTEYTLYNKECKFKPEDRVIVNENTLKQFYGKVESESYIDIGLKSMCHICTVLDLTKKSTPCYYIDFDKDTIRLATPKEIEIYEHDAKVFSYGAGDYVRFIRNKQIKEDNKPSPFITLGFDITTSGLIIDITDRGTIIGKFTNNHINFYTIITDAGDRLSIREDQIIDLLDKTTNTENVHFTEKQRTIVKPPTSKPKTINLDEYHSCADRIHRFFDNKETAGRPYGFIGDKKIFIGDNIKYRPIHISETGEQIFIDVLEDKKTGMVVNVEIYPNEKSNKEFDVLMPFKAKPVKYLFTVLPENESNTELVLDDCITRY